MDEDEEFVFDESIFRDPSVSATMVLQTDQDSKSSSKHRKAGSEDVTFLATNSKGGTIVSNEPIKVPAVHSPKDHMASALDDSDDIDPFEEFQAWIDSGAVKIVDYEGGGGD